MTSNFMLLWALLASFTVLVKSAFICLVALAVFFNFILFWMLHHVVCLMGFYIFKVCLGSCGVSEIG